MNHVAPPPPSASTELSTTVIVPARPSRRWMATLVLSVLVALSLLMAWTTLQRLRRLEQELVRRQQDSQALSNEARLLAKRAEESARDNAAHVALLEARVAEVAVARSQLEGLIQSMSRSRDENLLSDIDAALRVAQQQAALTGSAEPLVLALKQAGERLARYNQPRLDGVRRAAARDLDRIKAVSVADIATLTIKLDEAVRLIDELPLLSQAQARKDAAPAPAARASERAARQPSAAAWMTSFSAGWDALVARVWDETRALVRVTRIEHPDAMLMAPEQAFFLRENVKLRMLNARLALLSRQFDTAQSELIGVQAALERYFDAASRRTGVATDLVKQVAAGASKIVLPRPDETLAALAAVNGWK